MGQLCGEDLVPYADAITEGIAQEVLPEEAECGLMLYFHGSESIKEKVHSIEIQVEDVNGTLCGVAVCKANDTLSPVELEELKSYISGQYSDGWGEGLSSGHAIPMMESCMSTSGSLKDSRCKRSRK